jgi:hypothetical protein
VPEVRAGILGRVTPFVTAGAGFLLAVLWFDLMFDVQVLPHRRGVLPEPVLASIAGYYRRVTTDASPMNRLVATMMLATTGCVIAEVARGDRPHWAAWASLALVLAPVALAGSNTVPNAVRLGQRKDAPERQSALARSILRDHLFCLGAIVALMTVQLAAL